LIGLMVFSFGWVGAVNKLRIGDYFENEKRRWPRLHEKGGKRHEYLAITPSPRARRTSPRLSLVGPRKLRSARVLP
jgi:hypothetical protein